MAATLRWIASIVALWAGVAAAQGGRPVETRGRRDQPGGMTPFTTMMFP